MFAEAGFATHPLKGAVKHGLDRPILAFSSHGLHQSGGIAMSPGRNVKGPTSRNQRVAARFGERLHSLRLKGGMTLLELAASLGLSAHGYISELESGKKQPTIGLVLRVAELFDVSTDELLKDDLEIKPRLQADAH